MSALDIDLPADAEHEQVGAIYDRRSGLRAIIAVHSTALGPALGGTRFRPYESFADALSDVLALSRAMSYKAALAGVDLGGGKAVIIGDPAIAKNEALLRAYSEFVDSFGGRYLTAADVGTSQSDMDFLGELTAYATGRSATRGGSGDSGPVTAYGVVRAMEAAAKSLWGSPDLSGRRVAVSGVGKVGRALAVLCAERGASLTVADVEPSAVKSLVDELASPGRGAGVLEVVEAAGVHTTSCDVFAPCALGGAVTRQNIGELRCALVCGGANNQLADRDLEGDLARAGISYVPDYLANAGGIINISHERGGYDPAAAREQVGRIYDTTSRIFEEAEQTGELAGAVADRLAEERIAGAAPAG